jgi:histone-lysine N-methyltransferase SETDB1
MAMVCLQCGQELGDEYFAELDLIEVVERYKEGYESDVDDDDDAGISSGDNDIVSDHLSLSSDEEVAEPPDQAYVANKHVTSEKTDRQTRSRNREPRNPDGSVPAPRSAKAAVKKADAEAKPKFVSTRKLFGKDEDVYIMDAKEKGNIGRYLNHSCNPNVFVQVSILAISSSTKS